MAEATRDAVLTALDLLGGERPARLRQRRLGPDRPHHPRAGEPGLPDVRPGHRARADPGRLHHRALHPVAGRHDRGRLHRAAARPGHLRHHLRLRPARRHLGRARPLRQAGRPAATDRHGQRGGARCGRSVHLLRRRGGGRAGGGAPRSRSATAASGWPSGRSGSSRPSRKADGFRRAMRQIRRRARRGALALLGRGRPGRGRPAARRRGDRHRLRLGPHGARRDPGRAPARVAGAGGRLRHRLRRLPADRVHRPATDDGPAAGGGHGAGGRRGASSTRSPACRCRARSSCTGPSSWCAPPPAPPRSRARTGAGGPASPTPPTRRSRRRCRAHHRPGNASRPRRRRVSRRR